MNLLQIAKQKKSKLEAMATVKLNAVRNSDGLVVIADNGVIIPTNELQSFTNNIAYVSGVFASMVAFQSACRQNKI